MGVINLNSSDISSISSLAKEVWPFAYGEILSAKQLQYMLNAFYSANSLQEQMQKGHLFYGFKENDNLIAFIAVELNFPVINTTKIHKLYVLPNQQGKQLGKKLIDFVSQLVLQKEQKKLILNVNRYNSAKEFYTKLGFIITKEEDIEIGQGYLMEDFVMEKIL